MKAQERLAQQARARIPFNPLDVMEITGANVERLKTGMETFGWNDFRFVTQDQAQANGWSMALDAGSVRVLVRHPITGAVGERTLFNAQNVMGMPSLDQMLGMSEAEVNAMRGTSHEPVAVEDAELDDAFEIAPGRRQDKDVRGEGDTALSEGPEEVSDLFFDAPVGTASGITPELSGAMPNEGAPGAKQEFAAMAPYWLNGLHNHEGVELAKQVNRLIESKKLADNKLAIATLLNSFPDHRRLGLEPIERSKYLTDPHLKANVSQPAQLLDGALVRDNEGAYRPKAGGNAVLIDKGTSLVLKSKTEHAYRGAMELAKAKGWTAIELKGKPKMLAQAWVEAQMMGLQVINYTPTEVDRVRLAERMAEVSKRREAMAKTVQQAPEVVEVRPVADAAGIDIAATVTYTVQRVGQPPVEFGSPREAAQAYVATMPAESPVVTRTVARVGAVVRSDVVAGLGKDEPAAGNALSRPDHTEMVVDHEFEAALAESKQQAAALAPGEQSPANPMAMGRLVRHGPAPYNNEANNKASYFVTLEAEDGQARTVWGKDLKRSIEEATARVGDQISVEEKGRVGVEVEVPGPDGTSQRKPAHRVSWETQVLSRAISLVPATAGVHIGPIVKVENGRVAQKTGRSPDDLVWHDISNLQGKVPAMDEMAEIRYADGVGRIKENENARELGR